MCIAIYKPSGKVIPEEYLFNSFQNNYDGAGFMYIKDNAIHIHKGFMTYKNFLKTYTHKCSQHKKSPFVVHMRIATSGASSCDMTHPFKINKHLAFCHNGVLYQIPTHAYKSDTFLFNQTILQKLPEDFIENNAIVLMLADYISTDKLVFLRSDGKVYIINEDLGEWEGDVWYSNDSYKKLGYYSSKSIGNQFDEWDEYIDETTGGVYKVKQVSKTGRILYLPKSTQSNDPYTYNKDYILDCLICEYPLLDLHEKKDGICDACYSYFKDECHFTHEQIMYEMNFMRKNK